MGGSMITSRAIGRFRKAEGGDVKPLAPGVRWVGGRGLDPFSRCRARFSAGGRAGARVGLD
jgi:hypothetical protein